MLSTDEIAKHLANYGVSATPLQCDQVKAYIALLLKWNRSISLTSITDELEILSFHFGESAFALSRIHGMNGRLADVGSGAGFPGLALRIFGADLEVALIESNARKCAFLSEAVRQLRLDAVRVLRSRFEDEASQLHASFDFVVSRALGGYADLLSWSREALKPSGRVILWLGLKDVNATMQIPGWNWQPPISIPGSTQRYLLVSSPGTDSVDSNEEVPKAGIV
ncbi:MAG: 16S rRNA (guanine(527)-N(7))-methyltransferase RsmG [Candidatus Acidiferrales bacterium]